jgi:hypothetical protein
METIGSPSLPNQWVGLTGVGERRCADDIDVWPHHTHVFRNLALLVAGLKRAAGVCENLTEAVGHVNALYQQLPQPLACRRVTMQMPQC